VFLFELLVFLGQESAKFIAGGASKGFSCDCHDQVGEERKVDVGVADKISLIVFGVFCGLWLM
jgi:hypothetical protein